MNSARKTIEALLGGAGVAINGSNPWDIHVNDERVFGRVLAGGDLAFGDSNLDGWWECEALDQCICRLAEAKLDEHPQAIRTLPLLALWLRSKLLNLQKGDRALAVAAHYDEDPAFYRLFLDARMTYTCANWDGVETLDQAQEQKLERTCEALELKPRERVLDIGCGWGSLMHYANEKYDADCTGITIASNQAQYVNALRPGSRVRALVKKWQAYEPPWSFDKIGSVGMFEHVGRKNYDWFFDRARGWLKPGGIFLLHTIWTEGEIGKSPWLNKHIFPNGELPRPYDILKATHGKFVVEQVENFGPDYDRTAMAWYRNLVANREQAVALVGEHVYRMYCYYLQYVAGGFRARVINVGRFKLRKI